jgi:hypothetical protein
MRTSKIRIGLLIDDFNIPFWAYKMIVSINEGDFAEVVLVVKKETTIKRPLLKRLQSKFHFSLYKLYRLFENIFFDFTPNAFEKKNLSELIKSSEILKVDCIEKKFSDYIQEKDIEKIKEYQLDVFVRLGFRILRGDILKTAKLGVWSYHHGDNSVNRGGPAGFWEVFKNTREVGSILQILTEDLDGGEVLYRSSSTVHRLLNQTLNAYFWKSSLFIPRKLKELYEMGEVAFLEKTKLENEDLNFYSNKLYTTPGSYQFIRLFLSHYWDWFKLNIWKLIHFQQWTLLYSFNKKKISTSIFRYKRLTPPRDRFWADPFVIYKDARYYIFLEELIINENKGHISVIELDEKGVYTDPKIILKKSYHLSYPFVFMHEGEYYMIPESEQISTIQLYRSVNFPYEWEFCMNLMENIKAVDTTLFIKDNLFWLFTNVKEINGSDYSDELFIFFSENLLSNNWKRHPCNPVVSDVKSARPAGKLFWYEGKLYRPSQDCSYQYGYSTIINEVLVLDKSQYKEKKVTEIEPKWAKDVVGTHTLSFDHNLTIIDALITRRKF